MMHGHGGGAGGAPASAGWPRTARASRRARAFWPAPGCPARPARLQPHAHQSARPWRAPLTEACCCPNMQCTLPSQRHSLKVHSVDAGSCATTRGSHSCCSPLVAASVSEAHMRNPRNQYKIPYAIITKLQPSPGLDGALYLMKAARQEHTGSCCHPGYGIPPKFQAAVARCSSSSVRPPGLGSETGCERRGGACSAFGALRSRPRCSRHQPALVDASLGGACSTSACAWLACGDRHALKAGAMSVWPALLRSWPMSAQNQPAFADAWIGGA